MSEHARNLTQQHGPATLRVRRASGRVKTLDATLVSVDGPWVTVTGSWRGDQRQQVLVFSAKQVLEVKVIGERRR